jgi:hypothetical protein
MQLIFVIYYHTYLRKARNMKNDLHPIYNKFNDPQFHTFLIANLFSLHSLLSCVSIYKHHSQLANLTVIFGLWMVPLITGTEILVIFHYRNG